MYFATAWEMLFRQMKEQLSFENIKESVHKFGGLFRLTGSQQGEEAVDYILYKMQGFGVQTQRLWYDAYLSVPLEASVTLPDGPKYTAIAAVYSGEVTHLQGEMLYDGAGDIDNHDWSQNERRFAIMRGKIVLTQDGGSLFAQKAHQAGASAVIQIQTGQEELIHHSAIGMIWGTPVPSDMHTFNYMPYVCVTRSTGESLLANLKSGKDKVSVHISMDNTIKHTSMPVATIKGKSDKYILVSAHYDSWYEGITDNACADAILIEYARVFQNLSYLLDRSIKIAWWSGHSDGRYAGSTWFCDNYWTDLAKNCVAHINIDLAGCKNANHIRARTTLMEGEAFTARLIEKYTGNTAKPYIPMIRGADQSFWGPAIPISIMLKYEPLPTDRDFDGPSGGVWWHTDQDTIDKMDAHILERDTLINAEMICYIADSKHLPVDIIGYIKEMRRYLKDIETGSGPDFALGPVFEAIEQLESCVQTLLDAPEFESHCTDDIIKTVAGELTRLTYSYSSRYYHDRALAEKPFPLLQKAVGLNSQQTTTAQYLFTKNEYIRQRNRLTGQISKLAREVRSQLLWWSCRKQSLRFTKETG